jgi:CHASE1-domain containing sensor protein
MNILTETVEVAKWIPMLALGYMLFLKGLLFYIVHLRHNEHSQAKINPDAVKRSRHILRMIRKS